MRLIYHPDAEAELLEAVEFYSQRVPGLGDRFLRAFDAAITAIQAAPERWRLVEGDVRRHLLRRFPYGIYYRVRRDEVYTLVVKHHSRHPDY
ncbi:MAG: type II toxin-antitoxin system RelE/ParE family toxin [Dehalococcoidia bacterium]